MNRQRLVAVQLFLAFTFLQGFAFTQQKSESASEKSYRRARQVLEAGIEALGGLEALRAIQDFTLRESGKNFFIDQSPSPNPPFNSSPVEETTIVDLKGGRAFNELKNSFPGGVNWTRTIIKGGEGFTIDLRSKTLTPVANPSVNNFRNQMRRLPHLFLLEVMDAVSTARWIGEDEFQGKKQNVISYVRADGRQLALYFDARTNLFTKYDYLYTDGMVGDSLVEQIYTDYREVGRLKVPGRRILNNANDAAQETTYVEVKFNTRPEESVFEVPTAGLERVTPAAAAATPPVASAVNKLAEGVYVIQSVNGANYNVLFVAFGDHVLVVDAPEPFPYGGASAVVLGKIRETLPGKPVKYLVLTHHHSDHAGGARGYIAEGVAIVTTPGNRGRIGKLAAAPFTVTQDALSRNKREPVFELVSDKRRIFSDAGQRVELYDIGPSPHADEMLVAYLPKERILFQADLVLVNPDGTLPAASDASAHLAEKIQQLGLNVEKIVGAHGRVITMDEMRAALEKRTNRSAER
jgi:glyoxylase-like metal-dependent hydrolase (beta-lactamase superfamily II)